LTKCSTAQAPRGGRRDLAKVLVRQTLRDLQTTAFSPAQATPFYTALAEKIGPLDDLSAADKQAFAPGHA